MIVAHAHYSTRDPDRLDITRAGCDRLIAAGKEAPGAILAPSARLVYPALRRLKEARSLAERKAIFATYRAAYLTEIDERALGDSVSFGVLFARRRVVLVCFCRPDPEDCVMRCHRVLAAEWLAAHGATNIGAVP